MPCKDCTNNCPQVLPDCCIVYTGDDIPALGICNGDLVCEVEKVIIDKIVAMSDGTGISLSEVTLENCIWLKDEFGTQDKNLANLLQLLIDTQCTLKQLIDDAAVDPASFDILCLENLSATPNSDEILQEVVRVLCSIKTTVDAIPSTYVKISDINTYISNYLSNSVVNQYYQNLPAKVALPYFGDLGKFDNAGKGIESQGFKNIYICNGQNGTPDLRGRAVVGAVKNIPGGSLDSSVDPTLPANAGTNYVIGDKFGKSFVNLTIPQLPAHTHSVTDPGHTHGYSTLAVAGHPSGSANDQPRIPASGETESATTGISVNSTGGSQSHENRQPSTAAVWIMAIY
jgi:microcystin-dependent protein